MAKHHEDKSGAFQDEEEEEVEEEVEEAGEDGKPVRRKQTVKRRKCGNCYGAGEEGQCCNTCYDVKVAYDKKGTRRSTHPPAHPLMSDRLSSSFFFFFSTSISTHVPTPTSTQHQVGRLWA